MKLAIEHSRKRQNSRGPDSGSGILTGDCWQLHSRLEDDSVDLFLTDPPYADMSAYERLAELAAKKLRPGGLCLAYCGTHHLPEVLNRMSVLPYYWCFSITLKNHHSALSKRMGCKWRPVVAFGKPEHGFILDCFPSSGAEKQLHEWQQPQADAEYFIERLTAKGDLVVDPFCGSGTTLAAAKKLGRQYLGCELDKNTARGARRRLVCRCFYPPAL